MIFNVYTCIWVYFVCIWVYLSIFECIWVKRRKKADLLIVSLKINLFSPWYSWKMAELALNNNQSLNLFSVLSAFYPGSICFCFFVWVSWLISGDRCNCFIVSWSWTPSGPIQKTIKQIWTEKLITCDQRHITLISWQICCMYISYF